MAQSPKDYRRLTPAELKRLGYSEGSKRRVLATIKRVSKSTPTLTDRQYAQLGITRRVGKPTTKEQYTKLANTGKIKYATKQARSAKEARLTRAIIPDIAPRHLKVIVKYHENGGPKGGGYASLTDKEKETFRSIFRQYSRDAALQALGSSPDNGAFLMAS
jgi:hypothetical protein